MMMTDIDRELAEQFDAETEVVDYFEPEHPIDGGERTSVKISPIGIGTLIAANPVLHEPIIDGLIRRGETANIIAAPKVGKSWLAYDMALATATGGKWLGRYWCEQGRVLLIDNELHPATLAKRIPTVANALSIEEADYRSQIDVLSLRGKLLDLHGINRLLTTIEKGEYLSIILDAWYRAIPAGVSENDNGPVALLYNLIDQATERLDCSWVNIHHASKGQQGDKAVTDVGAGAGSQSRAADAHIVLRQHEEPGVVVLDAAVRSFAPVVPLALRWQYPCWHPANEVDAAKLQGRLTKGEQRQSAKDIEGMAAITNALAGGPATRRELLNIGIGRERCERLLGLLESSEKITSVDTIRRGNTCKLYHLTEDAGCSEPPT
jgi:AAA domain